MGLIDEWEQLLNKYNKIYIYGAGKIAKRIFKLISLYKKQHCVKGFVVTNNTGNPLSIQGVPVLQIDELVDKQCPVFIAVDNKYQEEILDMLKMKDFKNLVSVYKFTQLDENDIVCDIPESIIIDTRELCIQQFGLETGLDIIVELLAAEEYYGINNYGFELYNKMQDLRDEKQYAIYAEIQYRELIKSIESNGYNASSEIVVDKYLKLLDGGHRLALAIYHKIPYVTIRILDKEQDLTYGIEWFATNFSAEECNIISKKYEQVLQKMYRSIKGVLWPSVKEHFDEITQLINDEYGVIKFVDYEMPYKIFERFIHGVYHINDIAEWKIALKLEHMSKSSKYVVRVLDIDMRYPDFRVKSVGKTISKEGEKLKEFVQNSYKNVIDHYQYDIIFHTADNYEQSDYIGSLLKEAFSMQELICVMNGYKYMFIKTENDYFPCDFPLSFPKYKDIDVICAEEDMERLKNEILNYFSHSTNSEYNTKEVIKSNGNIQIRVELNGFLIFLVDLFCENKYLCDWYIKNSLDRRIKDNGYYVSEIRDEVVYRFVELFESPHKDYHLKYIREHIEIGKGYEMVEYIKPQYREEFLQFLKNIIDSK